MRAQDDAARAIFDEALDLEPPARAAFVDDRCCGDVALQARVTTLLSWHAAAESFLVVPEDEAAIVSDDHAPKHAGSRAGPYELLRVIGRGGMATVYEAARRDGRYERTVAVKVLDNIESCGDFLRRVKYERDALAGLDHPNIARLLDTGELDSGQPYLVMERIDGVPVDVYCRQHDLATPARLAIFLQVCAAVAAAHQRTILHRDLKPSNILVTTRGDAKLLDFGLARPLGDRATTTLPSRWLTPAYASPEQLRGAVLTTCSDVYSLGVVLFEMLTDRLPYAGARHVPLAVVRDIMDERVLRLRAVSAASPADLDAVVAKALHPDPARRYQTVDQLSTDIERFLAGRPVTALPDRVLYRMRRLVSRRPALVAASSIATLVLMASVLVAVDRARATRVQVAENQQLLYSAEMRLAGQAFEAGNLAEMEALLRRHAVDDGRVDLRGPEWYLLERAPRPHHVRLVMSSIVNGIAWSPDERWLASASSDGVVIVWNAATWTPHVATRHHGKAWQVAFSPDGRWLASVGSDGMLRLRELQARPSGTPFAGDDQTVIVVAAHARAARAVAFAPDGATLATSGDDGVVVTRRIDALSITDLRLSGGGETRSVAFSPDGRHLAASDIDGYFYLWAADGGRVARRYHAASTALNSLTFTRDSSAVVAASASGMVLQWNVETGQLAQSRSVNEGMMEAVAVRPDGHTIVGAHGPWITQWRVPEWEMTGRIAAHVGRVGALAMSPSGATMATAGADRTIKVWPMDRDVLPPWLLGHDRDVWRVTFSTDSARLFSASNDGSVHVWDASRRQSVNRLHSGVWQVKGLAVPRGDGLLVGGLPDGRIVVWEDGTNRIVREVKAHTAQVLDVALSPDGTLVAAAAEDGRGSVWRLNDLSPVLSVGHDQRVCAVAFSPDGRWLATSSDDATARIWTVSDGRPVATLRGHEDSVYDVVFSPDGAFMATSGADTSVRLWSTSTFTMVRRLTGHADRVWAVDVSRDGQRIVSASSDSTLKIWSAASGRELLSLRGPSAWRHVAFSPDGTRLAAGSASGLVALWDVGPTLSASPVDR